LHSQGRSIKVEVTGMFFSKWFRFRHELFQSVNRQRSFFAACQKTSGLRRYEK